MFELNQAILHWRRQMAEGGIKDNDVLDELESHLRDEIEARTRSGRDAQTAFDLAVLHLGSARALQKEFAKSRRSAKPSSRMFWRISCLISAVFVLVINSWTLIEAELGIGQRLIGFAAVLLTAAYVAMLPYLDRLLTAPAYARVLAAIKMLSLVTLVVPVLGVLAAFHWIQIEPGIVPALIVLLLYIAVGLTFFAGRSGDDPGSEGGSDGPLRGAPGPIPSGFAPADRFGPLVQRSLEIAREEAARLGHDFVGTEHLLLGVLRLAGDKAIFRKSNLDIVAVRKEIEQLAVPQPAASSAAVLRLTPRAHRALKLARKEAKKQPLINAEHILLGLMLEGSGVAALALKKLGIESGRIREEIARPYSTV